MKSNEENFYIKNDSLVDNIDKSLHIGISTYIMGNVNKNRDSED